MVLLFVTYLIAPDRLGQLNWAAVDGFLLLLSGVGFGTVNVCQSVMISDCIDYEEYNSGYRPDGVFFPVKVLSPNFPQAFLPLFRAMFSAQSVIPIQT